MPDQPMVGSSGLAEPFRPKVFMIEVIQRAISSDWVVLIEDLSVELYSDISSEIVRIADPVLKESQSASCTFSLALCREVSVSLWSVKTSS